jgi:hypothetical protein
VGRYADDYNPSFAGCSPNPFNPKITIQYELVSPGAVDLRVFNLAGLREPTWEGRDDRGRSVAAGVDVCRLEAGGFRGALRMTLVR